MADEAYMPTSRAEARKFQSKTYFTGLPCRRGHVAHRYTSDQSCLACGPIRKAKRKAIVQADPALVLAQRQYHREHKAKQRGTAEGKLAHYLANKRYIDGNRQKVNDYYRERSRDCPEYAMSRWMRSTLHKVLSRANLRKDAKATELLGYNREQLTRHIEAQFVKGMGWHNRAEWHVDHITPVALMIKQGVTDPAIINALANLRPMWASENIAKSDKVMQLL